MYEILIANLLRVLICHMIDKPEVTIITPSPLKVQEGFESTMECKLHAANPKTNITWIWFKTDTPGYVLNYGPIYIISNIQRNRTGIYSCTANNSVGTSVADTIYVDVLCEYICKLQYVCLIYS